MRGMDDFRQHGFLRSAVAVWLVLAASLLGLSTPAAASWAPDTPMVFQLVRATSPVCEPTCPEWIYAAGSIEPYTPAAFRKFLKGLGNRRLPVMIASNGGDRPAAFEIGRMIRKRRLTTALGITDIRTCTDAPAVCRKQPYVEGHLRAWQANCISACPYLFAGGIERLNNVSNIIGLHRGTAVLYAKDNKSFKNIGSKKRSERIMQKAHREILSYLKEMGIDVAMEDPAYHGDGVYEVPITQQQRWRLVTDLLDAKRLTAPIFCKTKPQPENCVQREPAE